MIIGVDLGATKILSGIISEDGEIIKTLREPTFRKRTPDEIVDTITNNIKELIRYADNNIKGIAVAAPGPISYPEGVIYNTPNLKWDNYPLRDQLEKRIGRKILIDHDATVAALGEYYFGHNQKYKNLLYMTISSGVGGGMVLDGKVYRGAKGGAGEFGHMVVEPEGSLCGCGRRGCLEALASGIAIAKRAEYLIRNGEGIEIKKYIKDNANVTAYEVAQAARNDDYEAKNIINDVSYYLGIGISNLVNIFNPDIVVLGGGVMFGLRDLLFEPIKQQMLRNVFPLHRESLKIEVSNLGDNIGLIGCAALWLEATK